MSPSHRIVVMGVSGCGKTTIARALARELDVEFVEGDDFHPPANVQKMASGIPLTDEDRAPWLAALADRLRGARDRGEGLVMACSALKRRYRDALRQGDPDTRFVFLDGAKELIAQRLRARRGHYMPASLLNSQFAALERPGADEHVLRYDVRQSPAIIVADLVKQLRA